MIFGTNNNLNNNKKGGGCLGLIMSVIFIGFLVSRCGSGTSTQTSNTRTDNPNPIRTNAGRSFASVFPSATARPSAPISGFIPFDNSHITDELIVYVYNGADMEAVYEFDSTDESNARFWLYDIRAESHSAFSNGEELPDGDVYYTRQSNLAEREQKEKEKPLLPGDGSNEDNRNAVECNGRNGG